MAQSSSIALPQAAKSKKYVFTTLLGGNLFCSTTNKLYIAVSYNSDLHVFLIVLFKQLNAKFTSLVQEDIWEYWFKN